MAKHEPRVYSTAYGPNAGIDQVGHEVAILLERVYDPDEARRLAYDALRKYIAEAGTPLRIKQETYKYIKGDLLLDVALVPDR